MNMRLGAVVDAVIFAALAFAIWRNSRFAAIVGLAIFILERVWMLQNSGRTPGIISLVLLVMFVNGIRGTFAYYRLSRGEESTDTLGPHE